MHKALFLDRDGILNVDRGYVYKWEDIVWYEEVFEMIKMAMERGYKVIVLTNQSGIHYKKYTVEDVEALHKKMNEFLTAKNLVVNDWIYCAEMDSENRKPRPGMLLQAQKKYDIDLSKSFMIGDKVTDVFETDDKFKRPTTFLVKGEYDLSKANLKDNVRIFANHKDIVEELKKVL
ncbi:MAG: HAD-IIIA family hydrolase [Rhizobacter sp.]|nr:HAD-IIIA family hydrolase [Bacteriovorax sp.]